MSTDLHYLGRPFSQAEMNAIRAITEDRARYPTRAAISRAVCLALSWRKPDGGLKEVSCRVALLRMQADGHIDLPVPTRVIRPNLNRPAQHLIEPEPIDARLADLRPLRLVAVAGRGSEAQAWRDLIARHHYLGYTPLPGAQIRYLVQSRRGLVALLGFGAAAWKVMPRDQHIGWDRDQRERHLHLVVNNARFLILPHVRVRYLASSVLALACRQLADDWQARYGYRPVLLETFVDKERFRGTSYRAANWIPVGDTKGRGKMDVHRTAHLPVKTVYLYPLSANYRTVLTTPSPS